MNVGDHRRGSLRDKLLSTQNSTKILKEALAVSDMRCIEVKLKAAELIKILNKK